jgi:hypothetical protein
MKNLILFFVFFLSAFDSFSQTGTDCVDTFSVNHDSRILVFDTSYEEYLFQKNEQCVKVNRYSLPDGNLLSSDSIATDSFTTFLLAENGDFFLFHGFGTGEAILKIARYSPDLSQKWKIELDLEPYGCTNLGIDGAFNYLPGRGLFISHRVQPQVHIGGSLLANISDSGDLVWVKSYPKVIAKIAEGIGDQIALTARPYDQYSVLEFVVVSSITGELLWSKPVQFGNWSHDLGIVTTSTHYGVLSFEAVPGSGNYFEYNMNAFLPNGDTTSFKFVTPPGFGYTGSWMLHSLTNYKNGALMYYSTFDYNSSVTRRYLIEFDFEMKEICRKEYPVLGEKFFLNSNQKSVCFTMYPSILYLVSPPCTNCLSVSAGSLPNEPIQSFLTNANPTNGILTINPNVQFENLTVHNTVGQLVAHMTGHAREVDLTSNPNGLYLVSFFQKGQLHTERVLIQR